MRDGMEEKAILSQGEWRIMNLLWEKKNRTIMEMVEDFVGVTDWDKHTLIVMLKRMEAKGVVAYETIGRTKQYYPENSRILCSRKQKVFWTEYIGEVLGRCLRQW